MWTSPDSAGYEKLPKAQQIDAIRKQLLADPAWVGASKLVQRAAKGLENTNDLYLEYSGQIKAKHLSTPGGKIGMIGDAAYCGTPVSGAGTTLSLVGAYILAGELAKHGDDVKAGFQAYEAWMAPFAAGLQDLPPGVPQIALPATNVGIQILHTALGTAMWLSKWKVAQSALGWVFRDDGARVPLPDYSEYECEVKSSAESSGGS
jgi:2-polyprenyl-6-methoxyphenol hydroxylase-like FAD-dependent oxidoreductase